MPVSRRRLLAVPLAGLLSGAEAWSQPRAPLPNDALRVGVDPALVDSGLAGALQQAFVRDTGIAVRLVRRAALPMLDALERGELDAALANTPEAELKLIAQGLAHDRRAVAAGEFVIVGPALRGQPTHDAAAALVALRDAAIAAPGAVTFLSAADGSGTHVLEQTLWRAAKIAPAPPWYVAAAAAESGAGLIAQARSLGAYALVERGAWALHGGAPLAIRVEGDLALAEAVHVLRAFRATHAAGKIFVAWIAGPRGRRVVAARRGYRVPAA